MIRVVLENLLLFLLPSLLYVGYMWMMQTGEAGGKAGTRSLSGIANDAPLMWLFATGAILVLVTLVLFGTWSGGKPGQEYIPPSMQDGHISPGHIK